MRWELCLSANPVARQCQWVPMIPFKFSVKYHKSAHSSKAHEERVHVLDQFKCTGQGHAKWFGMTAAMENTQRLWLALFMDEVWWRVKCRARAIRSRELTARRRRSRMTNNGEGMSISNASYNEAGYDKPNAKREVVLSKADTVVLFFRTPTTTHDQATSRAATLRYYQMFSRKHIW